MKSLREQCYSNVNCDLQYQKLHGIRAVVSTYHEVLGQPSYDPHEDPPVELRHPFIAVEGTHRDSECNFWFKL